MLNYVLDIQFSRPFYECNLHGFLIFGCETSNQLGHKRVGMSKKY